MATTVAGPVNRAPQFQQNASPCQDRAPQFGQNREADAVDGEAFIGEGGAIGCGGEIVRGAGAGG